MAIPTANQLIRKLAEIVDPEHLTAGQQAGLANVLHQTRIELPEIYFGCGLEDLATQIDQRIKARAGQPE